MKIAGTASVILGCLILIFFIYCFFAFSKMAASNVPQPTPLIDWLAADIMYADAPDISPAEMARQVQFRIFSGGGVGLFFILVGLCSHLLAKPSKHREQSESER